MNPDNPHPAAVPTFRRRLLMLLGPALAAALLVVLALGILFVHAWLTYSAQEVLERELQEITSQIVTEEGRLDLDAYHWSEPHHLFEDRHIDPHFVQIFDAGGRLVRVSDNVRTFPAADFPTRLLGYGLQGERLFERLRTFRAGDEVLYYRSEPIVGRAGVVGYAQVSRFEPGIGRMVTRAALGLAAGLVPIMAGLILLIQWAARRAVAPLEQITRQTQDLGARVLDRRIDIPSETDAETRQLALALNHALERLEHAFEEMQRFTDNAAHQLQTPLTILRGNVEIALRRERTPEEYRETLSVLRDEIATMIAMVRGLLQIARIEQDPAIDLQPVDLAAAVESEAATFEAAALAKGLQWDVRLEVHPVVMATDDLLREVVISLLDNAIKYTARGFVRVTVAQDEEGARLEVEDSGCGIPATVLPHVTDRFYRGPQGDGDIAGSGLGLAIARAILSRLGGSLSIESRVGEGTRAVVRMPFHGARIDGRGEPVQQVSMVPS